MGFSLTGAHVIFFVAAVIVAGAVSGIFIAITMDISSSFSERGDRIQNQLDTDFKIINDPDNIPTADSDYIFYLKNIGSKKLSTTNETFQIFVDGDIVEITKYNFSDSEIQPSECSNLYVVQSEIGGGEHTLRVVGPQAIEDEFEFEI